MVSVDPTGFTAARVADALRREVLEGVLGADGRLKENDLVARFSVSRNTAREALRQLASEGLLVLRMHSGAAVRRLDTADVRDIFRVRRTLEPAAILVSVQAEQHQFTAITDAVARGNRESRQQNWRAAATASLDMHQAIVALHGSPRISTFFEHQLAQLRVAFWCLPFESELQSGWIERDQEIVDLLVRGRRAVAADMMMDYLNDSESAVIDEFRALEHTAGSLGA